MNRDELGFEPAVARRFDFLVSEYRFRCTGRSPSNVRFESESVFIEIYHGLKDYEVGIWFGRTGAGKTFDFRLFLRRFFPTEEMQLGDCVAETPEVVDEVVQKLATLFHAVGKEIIVAEPATFSEMENVRWWQFRPDAPR